MFVNFINMFDKLEILDEMKQFGEFVKVKLLKFFEKVSIKFCWRVLKVV